MCISNEKCVLSANASHLAADGQSTQCNCNFGFAPSITTGVSWSFACTCPAPYSIITGTLASGVALNACCPANSSLNPIDGTCMCNNSSNPAYFKAGNDPK